MIAPNSQRVIESRGVSASESAEKRLAAGLEPGSSVVVRVEGEHVVLIPRATIKRRLQQMFAGVEGSMAERRAEAAGDAHL